MLISEPAQPRPQTTTSTSFLVTCAMIILFQNPDSMYGGNKGMKAWIAIGFPGARASFTEWVKQHNVP
jgi:hypothetical protein